MTSLRLLTGGGRVVRDDGDLAELYAHPAPAAGWVRANVVASLDGAAAGPDGRSGSLGGPGDRRVFDVLRALADVVLVAAGTVRHEEYGLPRRPDGALAELRASLGQAPAPVLAVATRTGDVPDAVLDGGTRVLTCARAGDALARLRARVGADHVQVLGEDAVDLAAGVAALAAAGLPRVLCEGGPSLYGAVAAAGRLDELCLTWSPVLLAGGQPRILTGAPVQQGLRLAHLLEAEDGTLLGRWTAGSA